MGRDLDRDTRNEFEEIDRGTYSGPQCRCRHCGKQLTLQTLKIRHHLGVERSNEAIYIYKPSYISPGYQEGERTT